MKTLSLKISKKKRQVLLIFCQWLFVPFVIGQSLPVINFQEIFVKSAQKSSAFINIDDINNDGKPELVHSTLMEGGSAACMPGVQGALRIFQMGATMTNTWSETMVVNTSAGLGFINDPQIFDVNGDGNKDILIQQGFIQTTGGSHQWLEGPGFAQRHDFNTAHTGSGNTMYFWHHSKQLDLDGDGLLDILTTSCRTLQEGGSCLGTIPNPFDMPVELTTDSAKIEWYRNLGNGNFDYYELNDSLGGVFIDTYDIDGDSDQDIVVSQFFWGTDRPALVWLEQTAKPSAGNAWKGTWQYHIIDNTTGLGYYYEFSDINADGADELVYCNHNNQNNTAITYDGTHVVTPGLYYFDIPVNPATSNQWTRHTIYEGFRVSLNDMGNPASQGSPGIFSIGDVDLNGMPDIAISGDGNDSLYLIRQKEDHTWDVSLLDSGPMFGDVKMYDLDNDGELEIIGSNHNYGVPTIPDGFIKIYDPQITSTGITSFPAKKINLYPNPANDIVWITAEEKNFIITNILGMDVTSICNIKQVSHDLVSVDVSNLAPGTYIISGEGYFYNKISVQ